MTLCFVRCWRVIRSSGCVALQSKRNVCSCLMRLPHGIRNHSSDRMSISTNEISRGWDKFLCARGAIYFHNTQPIFQIRRLKSGPKMRPVFWSQKRIRPTTNQQLITRTRQEFQNLPSFKRPVMLKVIDLGY